MFPLLACFPPPCSTDSNQSVFQHTSFQWAGAVSNFFPVGLAASILFHNKVCYCGLHIAPRVKRETRILPIEGRCPNFTGTGSSAKMLIPFDR